MGSKKYLLPYHIDTVLNLDFPDIRHYGVHGGEEDIDCPFCHKKRKAHVSYKGDVFRCNACDTSGGILKLHMLAKGFSSTKEAKSDLDEIFKNISSEDLVTRNFSEEVESKPFPDFILDHVYSNLLENLILTEGDKNNLISRGLTEEDIILNGYRSYPEKYLTFLAEKSLYGVLNTDSMEQTLSYFSSKMENKAGIAGYYISHGDVTMMSRKQHGYMIPVRNLKGEITSMQIRNTLPENATEEERSSFRKYTWLSSKAKFGGCGVHDVNQIHFSGFDYASAATPTSVIFTEGCLKADVASSLMKQIGMTKERAPFIAVMGVNNTAQLPDAFKALKERGTKEIALCFDMDYTENPNVSKAREKVKEIIIESGLTCRSMNWNPEYKGIDDYLLHIRDQKKR